LSQGGVYERKSYKPDEWTTNFYQEFSHELSERNIQVCDMLLEAGVDIDGVNENGETPIMCALKKVSFAVAQPAAEYQLFIIYDLLGPKAPKEVQAEWD